MLRHRHDASWWDAAEGVQASRKHGFGGALGPGCSAMHPEGPRRLDCGPAVTAARRFHSASATLSSQIVHSRTGYVPLSFRLETLATRNNTALLCEQRKRPCSAWATLALRLSRARQSRDGPSDQPSRHIASHHSPGPTSQFFWSAVNAHPWHVSQARHLAPGSRKLRQKRRIVPWISKKGGPERSLGHP